MKKINKNLLIFTSIASFFGISLILIFYKFIPTFFIHTVYYCQLLINSYFIKIPHEFNLIIFVFIFFVSFVFLTKVLITFIKIRRMKNYLIKNEKKVEKVLMLAQKVGLKNKVSIVKDTRLFAFCLGIRRPRIYISTKTVSIMTIRQLEAILFHEKYHLEHADSLTLFIGSLPQLLFPFFPILPKLLENYKIEREIKADRQAVKKLGTKPVIGVLKKLLETHSVSPVFVSSIAQTNSLDVRIKSLLNRRSDFPKIKRSDFLISALSLGFIILAIAAPVHAVEINTGKKDTIMVCLEGKECAKWCKAHNSVNPMSNMSRSYSKAR